MRARTRFTRGTMRAFAMTAAGAVAAPFVWAARRVLARPALPHAIAASHRVLRSSVFGRLSYYVDDAASGPPVLLLHDVSAIGCAYEMRGLFDELRVDRAVVAADLPGYGSSERSARAWRRDDYVAFVEEIASTIARRYNASVDLVVVGTTGELAAAAAVRSARHIRSLAIVSPTGFAIDPDDWLSTTSRRAVASIGCALAETRVVATAVHRALTARAVLRRRLSRASGEPPSPGMMSYLEAARRQPRAACAPLAAELGALSCPRVVDDVYDAVCVPLFFLHGSGDDVSRAAIDVLCESHLGKFRRGEIRGARAMPHVERAAETAAALRAFWRGLGGKAQLRLVRGDRASNGPRALPASQSFQSPRSRRGSRGMER